MLPDKTPLDIVGEHQGGIKRVPKMLDELGMSCDKLDNARRCSLFATRTVKMEAPESAWQTFDALDMRLVSHPGVFGHGKVDEGTQLLLQALEETLPKKTLKVLDMAAATALSAPGWLNVAMRSRLSMSAPLPPKLAAVPFTTMRWMARCWRATFTPRWRASGLM